MKRRLNILPDEGRDLPVKSQAGAKNLSEALRYIEAGIRHEPVEHLYLVGPRGEVLKKTKGDEEKCFMSLFACTWLNISSRGNLILTHNHPEEKHACLSLPDLATTVQLNLKSIRAVTPTGQVCYLNKPKEGFKDPDKLVLRLARFYSQCSVALSTGVSMEPNEFVRSRFNRHFQDEGLSMDLTTLGQKGD
jgi:hypothetical protein